MCHLTKVQRPFGALSALLVACAALAGAHGHACGQSAPKLIDGVIARSTAIVSGKLAYSYHSQSKGAPAFDEERVYIFEDVNWAETHPLVSGKRINANGYFLDFRASPQPDGLIEYSAAMQRPESFASRTESNRPPIFAGSLWYQHQLEYLQQHRHRARIAGEKTFDGVKAIQVELDVPAADWHAFHFLSPQLKNGGVLRLFVSPELAFAVPRSEHVDPTGLAVVWFEASDFHEQAPGVFFPNRISSASLDAQGVKNFELWYDISPSLINQPIPPEEFEVDIPIGTSVHDARDPSHVTAFRVTRKSPSVALAELSDRVRGVSQPRRGRTALFVVIGVAGGALFAGALLLAYRRMSG